MGLGRLMCAARAAGFAMVPSEEQDDPIRPAVAVSPLALALAPPVRPSGTALAVTPRNTRTPAFRDWWSSWWMGRAVA